MFLDFSVVQSFWEVVMKFTNHRVPITPSSYGVLIFHTWRSKIPDGIQVLRQCGGASTPATATSIIETPPSSVETIEKAHLGLDSFLKLCSIDSVVLSEAAGGYCRLYANWSVNPEQPGYNVWWEGAYGPFLCRFFEMTYKNVKIKRVGEKISLCFSEKRSTKEHYPNEAVTLLFVAAEKPAAETAVGGSNTLHLPKKK